MNKVAEKEKFEAAQEKINAVLKKKEKARKKRKEAEDELNAMEKETRKKRERDVFYVPTEIEEEKRRRIRREMNKVAEVSEGLEKEHRHIINTMWEEEVEEAALTLLEFIKQKYESKTHFCKVNKISKQHLTVLLKKEYIVYNNEMYSKRSLKITLP